MIKKENTAAVVVAYNIKKYILLENIKTYSKFVDKVIVVDNSDRDNSLKDIQDSTISYIKLNGNEGIAKGLNVGIKYAIENGYLYVLTMDQDSSFSNNLIDEYSKNEKQDVIIYSPNYLIDRKKKKNYQKNVKYMYWTMTSGNVLNLQLYKKNGTFKEELFIDAVDYEYCLRARKNGYKILQCNKAILKHNPGITKIKKILFYKYKYGYMSPIRLYYQVRNLRYLMINYNCYRALLIIVIKLMKILFLFDNKKNYLKMFKKAILDSKKGIYGKIVEE